MAYIFSVNELIFDVLVYTTRDVTFWQLDESVTTEIKKVD